ncbi:DUF2141 domain-containing protein [Spirosoma flavum]|uniref:DUF2141 domain-containing protein n=1 Tax=Spirosoma flavum TaxID=2048557 RepID=A0ABW6ADZ6_9BACT
MKTLITTILTTALFISSMAKPCFAQQTTPSTSTPVAATSVAATSVAATSVAATSVAATSVKSSTATYKLTVVVANVNKRTGKLYIGLANDKASFDGESFQRKMIDVPASGEITLTFEGLAPGRYAVRVYQDLNDNQKMDFSGRMPNEPFGFSNVATLMGPPDFDQSSFELTKDDSIRINMLEM